MLEHLRAIVSARLLLVALVIALAGCGGGSDGGPSAPTPPTTASVAAGCYSASYQGFSQGAIGCGLLGTSGNPLFDQRFTAEGAIQANFWAGVPATLYLFDECPGVQNALALPQRIILLGRNLSADVMIKTGSDLPLAGVIAHEWGHQAQFAFGWMRPDLPTVRNTELEADAFSGYYMALRKGWAGAQLNTYFQVLFSLGDYEFNDRNHHGTPNERVAAGLLGMQVAAQSLQTGVAYSYQQLHDIFSRAVALNIAKSAATLPKSRDDYVEKTLTEIDFRFVRAVAEGNETVERYTIPPASLEYRQRLVPYVAASTR